MEAYKREKLIIDILEKNHGYCSVEDLAKFISVSTMTIRRDLDKLKRTGMIEKRHGGAVLNKFLHKEIPYNSRGALNKNIKEKIALQAFELIEDNSTILLDAGTTTLEIAYLLTKEKNVTVVTNDLTIASYLSRLDINICLVGGFVENLTNCTSSIFSIDFLKSLNVNIAFIATTSINNNFECMVSTAEKAGVKKAMMGTTNKSVLVVDDSKFGVSSFCKVAEVKDFSYVITNYIFESKQKNIIENNECSIINI